MIAALNDIAKTALTTEEERDLIATVQNIDSDVVTTDDGTPRTVYYPTRASLTALDLLTSTYIRSIKHAASCVHETKMSREDALGVASLAFVTCVREFNLTRDSSDRLSWIAPSMMKRAVEAAAYGSSMVSVSTRHVQRFTALMRDTEGDAVAAYELCKSTANDFAPSTFLACYHALKAHDSLTAPGRGITVAGRGDPFDSITNDQPYNAAFDALSCYKPTSANSVVDDAYIAWLFTTVTDAQSLCLRLAYGFDDAETNKVRVNAGFREAGLSDNGGEMPDGDVGTCLGKGRVTTQRFRTAALEVMRAAIERELLD